MEIYNQCLLSQFDALTTSTDSFLDRDFELERSVGSIFHPSISINNHTFRGEYDDSNELFKAICSTMLDRPSICSVKTFIDKTSYTNREQQAIKESERIYNERDMRLQGMDRRAKTAEVVLGMVVVVILNCACISYFKLYNKKKSTQEM